MRAVVILTNWSATVHPAVAAKAKYLPPEAVIPSLQGEAQNHPRLGKSPVITSPIVGIDGRKITTESGTVYRLGKIDPKYRTWLRKNRPDWDWRKPIQLLDFCMFCGII